MLLSLRNVLLFKQAVKNFGTENAISSKAKNIQIPKISLHEYVWENLEKWADKTAVVCFETKRSYTYHQLYKKSLSITRFLKESLKYKEQETVGIVLPNVPEYPIVLLGAVQAGLRVTTCNPTYTSDEIKQQLKDSKSRIVFTTQELTPLVRQATDVPVVEICNNKSYTGGTISFDEISSRDTYHPINNVNNTNDIILLPYSSGTTGLPKGVQLNHFNIVSNLSQLTAPEFVLIEAAAGQDQDVVPAFLPFFHIYGQVVVMLHALIRGAKLITMPKFSSDNFVSLVKNYKLDVLFGVPLVAIMAVNHPNITKEDLIGIRYWMSGAAPLGGSDVERFRQKTNDKVCIIQGYGMTETSPVTLVQTKKLDHGIKTGGSGLLVPNTQAKIVPVEEPSHKGLEANKPGELLIKGPQVMPGYFNNAQANNDIFAEGWIRTGDIAYYDENDHFFVIDRCKELIKVKGFQVAPAELEEILRGHPDVDDVGVIGVPHPVLGEAPKAFVVTKSGQSVESSQLEEYVATKVSKHKHLIGGVVLVDAIPKSASGKILRRELRKM